MATYYVDEANGSNSNNGSAGAPFQTIQKCLDTDLNTTTEVVVRAGRYPAVSYSSATKRTRWITFRAEPGVIQETNTHGSSASRLNQVNYARFNNFTFEATVTSGQFTVQACRHVEFNNCTTTCPVFVRGDFWYIGFDHHRFGPVVRNLPIGTYTSPDGGGLIIAGTNITTGRPNTGQNVRVRNSVFDGFESDPLNITDCSNVLIEDTVFRNIVESPDPTEHVDLDQSLRTGDVTYRRCILSFGVGSDASNAPVQSNGSNSRRLFENCLLVASDISTTVLNLSTGPESWAFIHCTMITGASATAGGLFRKGNGSPSGGTLDALGPTIMKNCIIWSIVHEGTATSAPTNDRLIYEDYNCLYRASTERKKLGPQSPNTSIAADLGAHSISTVPTFKNAAIQDYRLAIGSAGVNAGDGASPGHGIVMPTTDLLGHPRDPSTPSMGCYEVAV